MLRKIIIISAIAIVGFSIWYATQFGTLQPVSFITAMKMSESASDTEQAAKVKIDAEIINNEQFPIDQNKSHFSAKDSQGTVFAIEYTGKDPLPNLDNGVRISVFGHVHGGESPYVHASQVVLH